MKIKAYEIIDHGYSYACDFPGEGTAFTDFEDCFTGIGNDAKEAYEDAVELASSTYDVSRLPKRPRGITEKNRVPRRRHEGGEFWYHVSIRIR